MLCRQGCFGSCCQYNIHFEPDELGGNFGETLGASFRPTILDYDGAALAPAEHAEPLGKGDGPLALSRWSRAAQPSDRRHPCLLCACSERPRCRRATEQRDELAPSCMSGKEHCEG